MGVQVITRPTPINRKAPLVAREFLGAQPAAAGTQPSAAAADHLHQLGTIQRQVTGFGLAQGLGGGNSPTYLVTDVGAFPALPEWTLEFWTYGSIGSTTNPYSSVGWFPQGTAVTTPNPVQNPTQSNGSTPQIGWFYDAPDIFMVNDVGIPGTLQASDIWVLNAATYDGAVVRLFENGTLVASLATDAAQIPAGWLFALCGNGYPVQVMDEVRISNVARYTSDYTIVQSPFTADSDTVALYHLDDTPLGNWINFGENPPPFGQSPLPSPIFIGANNWQWIPGASEDSSGNGLMLGVACVCKDPGGNGYCVIVSQLADVTPEDSIGHGYNVTSLQAQTGDLELVTPAGTSAITAITPGGSTGPTKLTIAAGGGGAGDPAVYIIPPVA
jgi:hypothetical protein